MADPTRYVACRWDLTADKRQRSYWLGLFRGQFHALLTEAIQDAAARGQDALQARGRIEAAREQFYGFLDVVSQNPGAFGRLDINLICVAREQALRRFGFDDPYHTTKRRENRQAMHMLPALLSEIDDLEPEARDLRLVQGIFAGNIFDLGAPETIELFRAGKVNFRATLQDLPVRPWFVDDLDDYLDRLRSEAPPWRCAVVFVDNAGCDVLLGMIPFGRELLRRGVKVVLTANSSPALNDITHAELGPIIQEVGRSDRVIGQALAAGQLELVPSGNGSPLIDLGSVSTALAEATRRCGADLVVLEGMGRAIESNFDASFTCDVLKVGMIKDRGVAETMGAQMYDLVLRFERRSA